MKTGLKQITQELGNAYVELNPVKKLMAKARCYDITKPKIEREKEKALLAGLNLLSECLGKPNDPDLRCLSNEQQLGFKVKDWRAGNIDAEKVIWLWFDMLTSHCEGQLHNRSVHLPPWFSYKYEHIYCDGPSLSEMEEMARYKYEQQE